jgi:hypothetical protein
MTATRRQQHGAAEEQGMDRKSDDTGTPANAYPEAKRLWREALHRWWRRWRAASKQRKRRQRLPVSYGIYRAEWFSKFGLGNDFRPSPLGKSCSDYLRRGPPD